MPEHIHMDGRNPLTGKFMSESEDLSLDELWALHERGVLVDDYEHETIARLLHSHVSRANVRYVQRYKALQGQKCIWCTGPMPTPGSTPRHGPAPEHCSNACRQAAYRSRREATE
jgi:hypothetical protein